MEFGDFSSWCFWSHGKSRSIYSTTDWCGNYWSFFSITSFIILYLIKKTLGLRVEKDEELKGLDLSEHGMDAYADFRLNQH